mgnify:CR=1 FL=1
MVLHWINGCGSMLMDQLRARHFNLMFSTPFKMQFWQQGFLLMLYNFFFSLSEFITIVFSLKLIYYRVYKWLLDYFFNRPGDTILISSGMTHLISNVCVDKPLCLV